MMKLILLAVAFIALVQPSLQLKCYYCKSEEYVSTKLEYNKLKKCDPDITKSETHDVENLSFDKCLKVIEKIDGKKYVVRTYGQPSDLTDNFDVYSCNTDLCNSSVAATATALTVCFSALFALSYLL